MKRTQKEIDQANRAFDTSLEKLSKVEGVGAVNGRLEMSKEGPASTYVEATLKEPRPDGTKMIGARCRETE